MVYLRGDYGAFDAEEIARVLARLGESESLSADRAGVIREQLGAGVVDVHAFLVQRCASRSHRASSARGKLTRCTRVVSRRNTRPTARSHGFCCNHLQFRSIAAMKAKADKNGNPGYNPGSFALLNTSVPGETDDPEHPLYKVFERVVDLSAHEFQVAMRQRRPPPPPPPQPASMRRRLS